MSALVRYEQARYALAECQRVDEVKDIRDKAEAMAAYARQAKDTEMLQWATEIKVRAERRCGEFTSQMEKAQGSRSDIATSSHDVRKSKEHQLGEVGLSVKDASRYEALAAMPDAHFETAVATAKDTAGQVTTTFMLREAKRANRANRVRQAKPTRKQTKKGKERLEELAQAKARGVSMLSTYARLTLTALRAQQSFTDEEVQVLAELAAVLQEVSAFN